MSKASDKPVETSPSLSQEVFGFDEQGNNINIPLLAIKELFENSDSGTESKYTLSETSVSNGSFTSNSLSFESVSTLSFNNLDSNNLSQLDFFQLLANNKNDVFLKITEVGFKINAVLRITDVVFNNDGTTSFSIELYGGIKRGLLKVDGVYSLDFAIENYQPDFNQTNNTKGDFIKNAQEFKDSLASNLSNIESKRVEENNKITGTDEIDLSLLTTTDKSSIKNAINELHSDIDTKEVALQAQINSNNTDISNLQSNQNTGVYTVTNLADLPVTGTVNISYKVTNDSVQNSNNGFYTWNGTVYVKDADLLAQVVEESNTSAGVSGKAVFDNTNEKINDFKNDILVLQGVNIFNPSLALDDKYVNNGTGVVNPNNGWSVTGFQKVNENTEYSLSNSLTSFRNIHFYDSDKNHISEITGGMSKTFTTPANTSYMQTWSIRGVNTFDVWRNQIQLELGNVITGFNPYKLTYNSEYSNYLDTIDENDENAVNSKAVVHFSKHSFIDNIEEYSVILPENIITEEGSQNPSIMTIPPTGGNQITTSVILNSDGVFKTGYDYKRRYESTSNAGSVFTINNLSVSNPSIVSFRFWIKDSDVNTVFGNSGNLEYWLYDGGILSQLIFNVSDIISSIGSNQTGTFIVADKISGNTEVKCIDKKDGWSCVVVDWFDISYLSGYNTSSILFYTVFNNVVTTMYGNKIDFLGFTLLYNEKIKSSVVYPDSGGKNQFPLFYEDDNQEIINNSDKSLVVLKENDNIYVRSKFNEDKDLIQKFEVFKDENFSNNIINFKNCYIINNTVNNSSTLYESGDRLNSPSDDAAPSQYNGVYIGANHGLSSLKKVTSTNHGKTNLDIGSEWLSSNAVKWYIIRIIDSNNLWVLSEDSSLTDIWSFNSTIVGNLIHSSSADNTSDIIVNNVVGTQLYPALKNHIKKVIIDDEVEIINNGIYYTNDVILVDNYDIVNPSTMLDNLISNVGTNYTDDLLNTALKNGTVSVSKQISYNIQSNGAIVINNGFRNYEEIDLNYDGFMQMAVGGSVSYPNIELYIPKALPISDGVTLRDFRTIENWDNAPASQLNLTVPYWENPLSPPDRSTEFLLQSGDRKIGMNMGYDLTRGVGSLRKDLVDNAFFLWTSRKLYPHAIDNKLGNLSANTWYSCVSYRIFSDVSDSNIDKKNATNLYHYKIGSDIIVVIDYHISAFDNIKLPDSMIGKKIEIIEKSNNMIINTDSVLYNGISIRNTNVGGYGYCVLKLT